MKGKFRAKSSNNLYLCRNRVVSWKLVDKIGKARGPRVGDKYVLKVGTERKRWIKKSIIDKSTQKKVEKGWRSHLRVGRSCTLRPKFLPSALNWDWNCVLHSDPTTLHNEKQHRAQLQLSLLLLAKKAELFLFHSAVVTTDEQEMMCVTRVWNLSKSCYTVSAVTAMSRTVFNVQLWAPSSALRQTTTRQWQKSRTVTVCVLFTVRKLSLRLSRRLKTGLPSRRVTVCNCHSRPILVVSSSSSKVTGCSYVVTTRTYLTLLKCGYLLLFMWL